ncbi:hypothetical protein [Streptomyces sp. NPDC056672]|uniref:hypothetical protein n=1 Tax=Streptomyces sp. NPDC056672 TaxID=3345906 RepID=UPI0036A9CF60
MGAACATAEDALDLTESISSHRTIEPLLSLADRLAEYDTPDARDFSDRARSALAA